MPLHLVILNLLCPLCRYCQMCEKQCRDENGFKCHMTSESHQRQLLLFGENPGKYLSNYSKDFEKVWKSPLHVTTGTVTYRRYSSERNLNFSLHLYSVAEPKLFIFGSGSDFVHNFGSGSSSGSSSRYSHLKLFYNSSTVPIILIEHPPNWLHKILFKFIFGSGSRSPNKFGSTGSGSATLHLYVPVELIPVAPLPCQIGSGSGILNSLTHIRFRV